ncbi:MAG: hypothetical protein ABSD08_21330 [Xanthobacteraceae bacterium]|jgi:hypothetical protein
MDSRPVPPKYLTGGQEYLDALVSLGLIPAFLGWGWDPSVSQWMLVLATSIVDAGGPLALNRLLFRAYNAKATPKEISPFIVRIFSPELIQMSGDRQFWLLGEKNATVNPVPGKSNPEARPTKITNVQKTFMGLELEMINSYQTLPGAVDKALAGYHARHHDWQRFRRNVERLAA